MLSNSENEKFNEIAKGLDGEMPSWEAEAKKAPKARRKSKPGKAPRPKLSLKGSASASFPLIISLLFLAFAAFSGVSILVGLGVIMLFVAIFWRVFILDSTGEPLLLWAENRWERRKRRGY